MAGPRSRAASVVAQLIGSTRRTVTPTVSRTAQKLIVAIALGLMTGTPPRAEEGSWRAVGLPYQTTIEGIPTETLLLEDGLGAHATVHRTPSPGPDTMGEEERRRDLWQPWTPEAGTAGRYRVIGDVLEAALWTQEHLYRVRAEKAGGLELEDQVGVWLAAREGFSRARAAATVAEVRSRGVEELAAEMWVADVAQMQKLPEPTWWVRPGGIVERILLCRQTRGGEPQAGVKRFPAGTRSVCFWARFRCSGRDEVSIQWLEGEHIVVQREQVVEDGAIVTGRLYNRTEQGLSVGAYCLRVIGSAGKEAELQFVVEPQETGAVGVR